MLKNFQHSHIVENINYEISFLDEHGCGYSFPCDKDGKPKGLTDCAMENYKRCLENPKEYSVFNEVRENRNKYKEPAHGTCHCGEEVYLTNQYYGACQCEKCGQWYNMFGQELLPPDQWEENY